MIIFNEKEIKASIQLNQEVISVIEEGFNFSAQDKLSMPLS